MHAVVLAAGSSSRFWPLNTRHKSLTEIAGRSLLERTLDGLSRAGIEDVIVVEGPEQHVEDVVDAPDRMTVSYVIQEEAQGMGNAVQKARPLLDDRFVVTGPYRHTIDELIGPMRDTAAEAVMVGAETTHPERYGMLDVDGDTVTGIVEKPAADKAPSPYKAVSTYLLDMDFFDHLDAVEEHEYSFEDALDRYMDEKQVGLVTVDEEPPSLKYPWDLFAFAADILSEQEQHIADSADIADSATIDGNVVIGEDVTVYEGAVIRGPAYIGDRSTVGNHAVVRDGTSIGADSTVGAHAEVRGSIIQPGFSMHAGFVGDSLIDRDVAIGAGAVTANRRVRNETGERGTVSVHVRAKDESLDTGHDRLGAIIGAGADIGTQANLMPGICIGRQSFVGPSTMLRENVGEEKTYYTVIEGRETERR